MKILIIDDNDYLSEFYEERLKHIYDKSEIIVKNTAESARTWLKSNNPDLIMMDIMFPLGSGFSVLNQLCKDNRFPFIAINTESDPETIKRSVEKFMIGGNLEIMPKLTEELQLKNVFEQAIRYNNLVLSQS